MSIGLRGIVSKAMMTTNSSAAAAANYIFNWGHGGDQVQLAGSFNGWMPVDMEKSGEKSWRLIVPVGLGRHEFKFVVDGKWVHDPEAAHDVNHLGSQNNFIIVDDSKDTNGLVKHEEKEATKMNDNDDDDDVDEDWEIVQKPDVLEKLPVKGSTMEIERKFVVPDNFQFILESHGFQLTQALEENLQDHYFDTLDHHLLHMDYWLRQRNGDWELKYPIGSQHAEDGSMLYHETSNPDDILARIRGIVPTYVDGFEVFGGEKAVGPPEPDEPRQDLNEMVSQGVLKPFAQLDTRRQWFQKGDVSIVIDDTDWGYRIGEIEILISDSKDISNAVAKIEDLAKQLNFTDFDMVALAQKVCATKSTSTFS